MISLSLVQYLPYWFWNTEIKKHEPHKSGFGSVVTDANGGQHHVKESVEEIENRLEESCDGFVNISKLDRDFEDVSLGKPVPPRTIKIEIPNNVPSKVRPIVIFPTTEAKNVVVTVTEYDGFGAKMVNTTVDPNQSHVINLNTRCE